MKIVEVFRKIGRKIKEFFFDESGGNLIEYALLIAFAIFIFFILVVEVTGLMDMAFEKTSEVPENITNE